MDLIYWNFGRTRRGARPPNFGFPLEKKRYRTNRNHYIARKKIHMSKADIMKWQPALSIQTTLQNIVAEEMLIFRTDFFTEQDNYQQF